MDHHYPPTDRRPDLDDLEDAVALNPRGMTRMRGSGASSSDPPS